MKRLVLVMLVFSMTFFIAVPRPAEANPGVVALGAGVVEIGGLAVWAGVALAGVVVGEVFLDKKMQRELEEFGRDVWESADTAAREAITASVAGMKVAWNTASTVAVDMGGAAHSLLKDKWNRYFGRTYVEDGKIVSVSSPVTVLRPSSLMASTDFSDTVSNLGHYRPVLTDYSLDSKILSVHVDASGLCTFTRSIFKYGTRMNIVTDSFAGTYPNAQVAYDAIFKKFNVSPYPSDVVKGTFRTDVSQEGSTFTPLATISSFAFHPMALPAPRVRIDEKGTVTGYHFPTIGRVKSKAKVDSQKKLIPFSDIVVGYPAIPGSLEGLRGVKEPAISIPGSVVVPAPLGGIGEKVPAIPVPGSVVVPLPLGGIGDLKVPAIPVPGSVAVPVPLNPALDTMAQDIAGVRTDVGTMTKTMTDTSVEKINWRPLELVGSDFTKKFPFSIPWDISRQLSIFDVSPKIPMWKFDETFMFSGNGTRINFALDFSVFDSLAVVLRWILLLMFDVSLALGIRKLLPE